MMRLGGACPKVPRERPFIRFIMYYRMFLSILTPAGDCRTNCVHTYCNRRLDFPPLARPDRSAGERAGRSTRSHHLGICICTSLCIDQIRRFGQLTAHTSWDRRNLYGHRLFRCIFYTSQTTPENHLLMFLFGTFNILGTCPLNFFPLRILSPYVSI